MNLSCFFSNAHPKLYFIFLFALPLPFSQYLAHCSLNHFTHAHILSLSLSHTRTHSLSFSLSHTLILSLSLYLYLQSNGAPSGSACFLVCEKWSHCKSRRSSWQHRDRQGTIQYNRLLCALLSIVSATSSATQPSDRLISLRCFMYCTFVCISDLCHVRHNLCHSPTHRGRTLQSKAHSLQLKAHSLQSFRVQNHTP